MKDSEFTELNYSVSFYNAPLEFRKAIQKDMKEMGLTPPKQFPLYVKKLMELKSKCPIASGIANKDVILESVAMLHEQNTKRSLTVEFKHAYNIYFCLSQDNPTKLSKHKYGMALKELGLVIKRGGGNKLKIYNMLGIPAILDKHEYI